MEAMVFMMLIMGPLIGWYIGHSKGRSFGGFILGFFLGPIGWIIIGLCGPTEKTIIRRELKLKKLLEATSGK